MGMTSRTYNVQWYGKTFKLNPLKPYNAYYMKKKTLKFKLLSNLYEMKINPTFKKAFNVSF